MILQEGLSFGRGASALHINSYKTVRDKLKTILIEEINNEIAKIDKELIECK